MGIYNNDMSPIPSNTQRAAHIAAMWDPSEEYLSVCDEVTDHMFDRLDVFVIGPKFDRARRRATNLAYGGPHKSRCQEYKGKWDRIDTELRRLRINRMLDTEMRSEAHATMSASEDDCTGFTPRQPAYADCATYYYETMFNPEAIIENELEEERRYWEY